jgi:hypothetical protein
VIHAATSKSCSCRGSGTSAGKSLWKLEGSTNPEIAERLECTLRTVERKLERIRAYWGNGDD